MRSIARKDINVGIVLVVLFVIILVAGFIKWSLLPFAAILLFCYIVLDKKKLRCPNCGGFENLDRLIYAQKHACHCKHCGEMISIS